MCGWIKTNTKVKYFYLYEDMENNMISLPHTYMFFFIIYMILKENLEIIYLLRRKYTRNIIK